MTTQQFLDNIAETFNVALGIVQVKNKDYGATDNPFKNFLLSEAVGVECKRAILVRLSDKIARISNLLDKQAEVKDETIDDTLIDAINYLAILKAKIHDERGEN